MVRLHASPTQIDECTLSNCLVCAGLNAKGFCQMVFPALEERKMLCLYTGVRDVKTPAGSHDIVGNTTPSQGEHALEPDKIGGVNRSRQLFVHDNRLRTA
eukprot:COSAG06_NODE_47749_length_337_cov_0.655462_1_plen_99_part_01